MLSDNNNFTSLDPAAFQQLLAEFLENRFRGLLNELNNTIPKTLTAPTCYISYPRDAGIDNEVKLLVEFLLAVNIRVHCLLPEFNGVSVTRFIQQIDQADHIILLTTPKLVAQYDKQHYKNAKILELHPHFKLAKEFPYPPQIWREIVRIQARFKQTFLTSHFHVWCWNGTPSECIPARLRDLQGSEIKAWPPYHFVWQLLKCLLPACCSDVEQLQQRFTDIEQVETWQNRPEHIAELQQSINAFMVYKKEQQEKVDQYIRDEIKDFMDEMLKKTAMSTIFPEVVVDNNQSASSPTPSAPVTQVPTEAITLLTSLLKQHYQH